MINMKKLIFTGSAVALITPMQGDGTVNFEELERLAEFHVESGTDAIVVCGTTGESATLEDAEHLECISRVVKVVAGRIPVIAGTGSNNTAHAIMMSKEAKERGADALLLVTPYYNKTSQEGLIKSFTAIVDSVQMPAIIYNVPSRTGVNINPQTALELSKNPWICGLKEASGNISQVAEIAALCGQELPLYSGNDDQVVPLLSLGGQGVISVVANVAPAQMHQLCRLWWDGKTQESCTMQLQLLELCNAMFCEVNPIPVKEAMNLLGWEAGPLRRPLSPMEPHNRERLIQAMKNYGLKLAE